MMFPNMDPYFKYFFHLNRDSKIDDKLQKIKVSLKYKNCAIFMVKTA